MSERFVLAREFIGAVAPLLGIEQRNVRRIVIDALFDDVLIVHVEMLGDKGMLNVVPTLEGVEITREASSEN
jgi:hypothetical protein